MRYQLELTLRRAEGALLRVLGTAERRGYQPVSIDGELRCERDRWRVSLTVEGERSGEALEAQLAKLYDCLSVEVSPCR